VNCFLAGGAVSCSAHGLLAEDKYRFHRMPSVDAFNQVSVYTRFSLDCIYSLSFFSPVITYLLSFYD
jgi:hypothetical protein